MGLGLSCYGSYSSSSEHDDCGRHSHASTFTCGIHRRSSLWEMKKKSHCCELRSRQGLPIDSQGPSMEAAVNTSAGFGAQPVQFDVSR